MRSPTFRLAIAAIAALTVAGCLGARETGAAGNLAFTYDTDDPTPSFDAPIAIGASIDLRAEDPLTGTPLPIDRATIAPEGVLEVVAIERGHVTLRGIGEGRATVSVTATRAGSSVSDSIELSAAAVGATRLASGCADAAEGVYLANSRIAIPFELERAPGAPLVGYGVHPFSIAPESALVLDHDDRSMQYLMLRTGRDPSRATITSEVDGARLYLEIVDEASIDGATLRLGPSGDGVPISGERFVLVQPRADGRVLCQGTPALDAIERTPSICTVVPVRELRADDDVGRTYGWLQVTGRSQGICRFSVRYPNAAGGSGLEVPFSLEVR